MKLHNCSISADGNVFTFELEDGTKIVKEFPFALPSADIEATSTAIFALAAALLVTANRVDELEAKIRKLELHHD